MNFDKRSIFKRAGELRRNGLDKSNSLKLAWSEAKQQLVAVEENYIIVDEPKTIITLDSFIKASHEITKDLNQDIKQINNKLKESEIKQEQIAIRMGYKSLQDFRDYLSKRGAR
jgi:hypothetical protein